MALAFAACDPSERQVYYKDYAAAKAAGATHPGPLPELLVPSAVSIRQRYNLEDGGMMLKFALSLDDRAALLQRFNGDSLHEYPRSWSASSGRRAPRWWRVEGKSTLELQVKARVNERKQYLLIDHENRTAYYWDFYPPPWIDPSCRLATQPGAVDASTGAVTIPAPRI